MVADLEAEALRHRLLALLDAAVHELFHLAAVHAYDVIVVGAMVELEHRHAALEVMASHEAGGLELSQHAVYGGETDVLLGNQQLLVDVLRAHVPGRGVGEDVEDLQARQRHLEARVAQVVALGRRRWFESLRHAVASGMMCFDYRPFTGGAPLR